MRLRIGALLVSAALLGGCSAWGGSDGRDHDPANRPGYALPGDRRAESADHTVRGGGVAGDAAVFQLVNGSDVVRVRVGDLGGDAYEVSTGDDSRIVPTVDVDGSTVVAGVRDSGLHGPAVVNVVLSKAKRWEVRLAGGAADEAVDLTGGPGGSVVFSSGTTRASAVLPAGSGTQRVQISGGAGEVLVRLAGNAPVRVAARNGASSVTVDGTTHNGVSGNSVWTPDGWDSATDRYDVDATSGVSTLTVERAF